MLESKCHNKNDYPLLYKWADWLAISWSRFLECQKYNILVAIQALVHCLICPHLALGAAHPQALCVDIRQCTLACVTTIAYGIPSYQIYLLAIGIFHDIYIH